MNSKRLRSFIGLVLPLLLLTFPPVADAGGPQFTPQQLPADSVDRLIVQLRNQSAGVQAAMASPGQAQALSATAGVNLSPLRVIATGAQLLKLPYRMTVADAAVIAQRLSDDPSVEYAEPDRIKYALLVPTDLRYPEQWHYYESAGGANLPAAWDITTGAGGIVIAVLDTGVLTTHADLASGRLLAGYDFITSLAIANDGDGRDGDPSDPGDWLIANECFAGSAPANSIWHGSHVMGTVGATANNPTTPPGGAGVNWNSMLLPVRVLGKCGGSISDIVEAMMWAAGNPVLGVPNNANPAHVLNLSLGGPGPCSMTEQTAIDTITTGGRVVVVAAGNSGLDASVSSPGNCNGVITVAATNRAGGRAGYTNIGSLVEIAAPGGSGNGVLSTINTGSTAPIASPAGDTYAFYQGTSMATPHVAGIISLMLSVNPGLTPTQVLQKLQATARAFPIGTGFDCTTATCGAGIVNAALALQSASNVIAPTANAGANQTADPATLITLDGSASVANSPAAIVSYSWIQTGGVPAVTLSGANTVSASFIAPAAATGTMLTFQLTATDDGGLTDTATVNVTLNNVAPTISTFDPVAPPGANVVFTVAVSDANGTTPTLTATGVPVGATFTPATGVLNWPNAGPLGNYVVTFTATDAEAPFTMVNDTATISIQNATAAVSSTSSSGSSSCFIATAAYGTPMADEIRYLRAFRDGYLLTNRIGRRFVELYNRHSPPIADYIGQRERLRRLVRGALMPLVAFSKWLVGDRIVDNSHHAPH